MRPPRTATLPPTAPGTLTGEKVPCRSTRSAASCLADASPRAKVAAQSSKAGPTPLTTRVVRLSRAVPPARPDAMPGDSTPAENGPPLHDAAIAALGREPAQQLLRDLAREGETARLAWGETALTVVTSRGLARQVRATTAALEVRCGRHAGAGS